MSVTHLTLLNPLSVNAIQERRQWPKYGGAIPIPPGQFTVVDTVTVLNKRVCIQKAAI